MKGKGVGNFVNPTTCIYMYSIGRKVHLVIYCCSIGQVTQAEGKVCIPEVTDSIAWPMQADRESSC
jgi:hypothetical protein